VSAQTTIASGARRRIEPYGVVSAIASIRSRSVETTNRHGRWLPAEGAAIAARSIVSMSASRTGSSV